MNLLNKIIEKAKSNKQTIVLPEGKDTRIIQAATELLSQNVSNVVVLINSNDVTDETRKLISSGVNVIVIEESNSLHSYAEELYNLRKHKGMTKDKAIELVNNAIYFGVMMVHQSDADGMVAGAIASTSDVIRPALQILRAAKNVKLVSSFFLMDVPNSIYGSNGVFAFADCGLVENPDVNGLTEIAIQTSKSFNYLTELDPVVAMLSYSTFGSAKSEQVDKVIQATEIVKSRYPNLKIDGELQLDAAIVPEVAELKAPHSKVAGKANVVVFPDLQSGNIGYKLVQRLANAEAYGPITQGLSKPVNDLSRGCNADDIVAVVAITAVQSQSS